MTKPGPDKLGDALKAGDRQALARAITLVESTRGDHRARASKLLAALLPDSGGAIRLGVSGAPGVGKSTFIEAFGTTLTEAGHKVAVLAVDPSSARSGGSILGDKTRMEKLARNAKAFIRPSPAGTSLGGIARGTRDAIVLVEAAGFDVVIVETVGVGQSESAVADLVDMFLLLLNPAGGDALQAVKRGIVEFADLLVVTKADGALAAAAQLTATQFGHGAAPGPAGDDGEAPAVVLTSALENTGLDEVWRRLSAIHRARQSSGALARRRAEQAKSWLWREIEAGIVARIRRDPGLARQVAELEQDVAAGTRTPGSAADQILESFTVVNNDEIRRGRS